MRAASHRSGFSFVEALIAMVVLSTVAAAALPALFNFTKALQSNLPAMNVARGNLERFYEYVREDWRTMAGLPISLTTPGPQPLILTLGGTTYTTTYAVNNGTGLMIDANGDGQEDYRRIQMMVSW